MSKMCDYVVLSTTMDCIIARSARRQYRYKPSAWARRLRPITRSHTERVHAMIIRFVSRPNGAKVAVAITFDMDVQGLVDVEHLANSITRVSTIIHAVQVRPLTGKEANHGTISG